MKKQICSLLAILLMTAGILCGCGREQTPAEIVKKQITSGVWCADMSEGTAACYTFTGDNRFSCAATVTAGGKSADFVREGTYAIVETDGALQVILQYPNVDYQVAISCTPEGDHYALEIAGCALYRKEG